MRECSLLPCARACIFTRALSRTFWFDRWHAGAVWPHAGQQVCSAQRLSSSIQTREALFYFCQFKKKHSSNSLNHITKTCDSVSLFSACTTVRTEDHTVTDGARSVSMNILASLYTVNDYLCGKSLLMSSKFFLILSIGY